MQDSYGVICAVDHATSVYEIANYDWDIDKACEVANARQNLLAVHVPCNFAKRDADYEEFCANIKRGEIKLGEVLELTAERIASLRAAHMKASRKGAYKRNKLYGNPATPESRSKGGLIGGRKVAESGQLAKTRELPQAKEAQREVGRKNVESGLIQRAQRRSNHIRWHIKRGLVNPACVFCANHATKTFERLGRKE